MVIEQHKSSITVLEADNKRMQEQEKRLRGQLMACLQVRDLQGCISVALRKERSFCSCVVVMRSWVLVVLSSAVE